MKKGYFKLMAMLVMLGAIAVPMATTLAQESAPAAAAPAGVEGKQVAQTMTLKSLFIVGGITMYPLALCSIAVVYFGIRNAMLLREKGMLRPDLAPQIEELLRKRDVQGVRRLCQENPCMMTSVLDAGLERVSEEREYDSAHVMEAVEEAGNEQMVSYMKPITVLSIIGVTSPMLGLLGTVLGMIKAFWNIGAGGMGKPEVLANNIGEALITTAAGLIIAIPAMMIYYYFKNNFIKTMSTMGRMIGHLMNVYRFAK